MPTFSYTITVILLAAGVTCSIASAQNKPATGDHQPKSIERMKMNEPMPTGMSRPGMMKGDVKNAEEKKDRMMGPMIQQEEKSMSKHPLQK
jgi:hypothetical protein